MAKITKHLKNSGKSVTPVGNIIDVVEIDFSESGNEAAIADVINLFNVLEGTIVERVYTSVKTAEGAAATVDIGTTADVDGLDAAVDCNTQTIDGAIPHTTDGTDALFGSLFDSDGVISATVAGASLGSRNKVYIDREKTCVISSTKGWLGSLKICSRPVRIYTLLISESERRDSMILLQALKKITSSIKYDCDEDCEKTCGKKERPDDCKGILLDRVVWEPGYVFEAEDVRAKQLIADGDAKEYPQHLIDELIDKVTRSAKTT